MAEYKEMMARKNGKSWDINFTFNGDQDVVAFIFYRVCFGMKHSFAPEMWVQNSPLYELPSEKELEATRYMRVGGGTGRYFLSVLVQPPAMAIGDPEEALRLLYLRLEMTMLAKSHGKSCYPVRLQQVSDHTQCIVWSACGFGWETPRSKSMHSHNSLSIPILSKLQNQHSSPPLIIICMQFGARLAAKKLSASGAPAVLWMQPCFFSEELIGGLLLGVIMPLLEQLHQPRMANATCGAVTKAVLRIGRRIFGSKWRAGCEFTDGTLPFLGEAPPRVRPNGVWLHTRHVKRGYAELNLADHTEHNKLHMAIKLLACTEEGRQCDLLQDFDAQLLVDWIASVLPVSKQAIAPIAALYHDEHAEGGRVGIPAVRIRIPIESVAFLHELRDAVLVCDSQAQTSQVLSC